MSVSIRPAYRSGKVPSAPPAVLAPAALVAALLIGIFGAAYQLATCSRANAAQPLAAPAVVAPARAHAPARAPAASPERAHGNPAHATA